MGGGCPWGGCGSMSSHQKSTQKICAPLYDHHIKYFCASTRCHWLSGVRRVRTLPPYPYQLHTRCIIGTNKSCLTRRKRIILRHVLLFAVLFNTLCHLFKQCPVSVRHAYIGLNLGCWLIPRGIADKLRRFYASFLCGKHHSR